MSTTFEWTIEQLTCVPQINSLVDVVRLVRWSVTGITTVNNTVYTEKYNGATRVPFDPNSSFIEYNNLTQNQIFDWVWNNPDSLQPIMNPTLPVDTKTKAENFVQNRLDRAINPDLVIKPLPW